MDYTFSGTTLSQVSDFSSEYLKLKKENTKTISLTSLLAEAVDSQSNKDNLLSNPVKITLTTSAGNLTFGPLKISEEKLFYFKHHYTLKNRRLRE